MYEMFQTDQRDNSWAQLVNNPDKFDDVAEHETRPFREYMLKESVLQYKDYFESDDEEHGFFEYLDNFSNRDQIRFMELFEDITEKQQHILEEKEYVLIKKREHNPQLSALGNMVLDLVDFKDRVRPMSNDIAMLEQTRRYQKTPALEPMDKAEFDQMLNKLKNDYTSGSMIQGEASQTASELEEPKKAVPTEEE